MAKYDTSRSVRDIALEYRPHVNTNNTPERKYTLLALYIITGNRIYYNKAISNSKTISKVDNDPGKAYSDIMRQVDQQEERLTWMDGRQRFTREEYYQTFEATYSMMMNDVECEGYCGINFYPQKNGDFSRIENDPECTKKRPPDNPPQRIYKESEAHKKRAQMSQVYSDALRIYMRETGATLVEIARRTGMSKTTVSSKVNKQSLLSYDQMAKIKDMLWGDE